jgi:hypothetical protein
MLLTEPDSKIKLAAGFGRHWPDARGVFVCDAWLNTPPWVTLLANGEDGKCEPCLMGGMMQDRGPIAT